MDFNPYINNNSNYKHGDFRDNVKNNNNNTYNQFERRPIIPHPGAISYQRCLESLNYMNRKYMTTSEPTSPINEPARPSLSLRAASYQTAANNHNFKYNNKTIRQAYQKRVEDYDDNFSAYRFQGANYFKHSYGEQQRVKPVQNSSTKYSPPPFVHKYNVQSQSKRNSTVHDNQEQQLEMPIPTSPTAYSFPRNYSSTDIRRTVVPLKEIWQPPLPSMSLKAAMLGPPTQLILPNRMLSSSQKKAVQIKTFRCTVEKNTPRDEKIPMHNQEILRNIQQNKKQFASQYSKLEKVDSSLTLVSKNESSRNLTSENKLDQHYQYYASHYHNQPEPFNNSTDILIEPSTMSSAQNHEIINFTDIPYVYENDVLLNDNQGSEHNFSKSQILTEKGNNNDVYEYDVPDLYPKCMDEIKETKSIKSISNTNIKIDAGYEYQSNNVSMNTKSKKSSRTVLDKNANKNIKNTISSHDQLKLNSKNNNCSPEQKFSPPSETIDIEKGLEKLSTGAVKVRSNSSVRKNSPAHRVLLYNRQSPNLSRVPLTARGDKSRRTRLRGGRDSAVIVEQTCSPSEQYKKQIKTAYVNEKSDIVVELVDTKRTGALGDKNVDGDTPETDGSDDDDDMDNLSALDDTESGSDSEDAYRTYICKLSQTYKQAHHTFIKPSESEEDLDNPDSLLVPSLFPNVPPYLSFSNSKSKGPTIPYDLFRVLKWRVTNVMPKVVRSILNNSGMRLLKKTNDWMGVWGKHMKSPCFKTVRPHQKINHLPGSFKIGRKDSCWKNLQKQMQRHGKKDFGFMPKTFIIPHDINLLRKNWMKCSNKNVKWIIKPPASARGTGIRVINKWSQIPKRKALIVQKYIERPLLISGNKFDLRLYVLVTSINPLRVYMHQNGLARFAAVKYSVKSDTLNDRCMHLTNYSINKFSSNYSRNDDFNACVGHKWTLKSLWSYLASRGIRTDFLWEALRSLVLRTLISAENSMNNVHKMNVESKYSCFELFGFDVLLDSELVPWLLEVNISPSLHSELPLDTHVKAPLVQGVLNTALFHVPPRLSADKQKEIALEMELPMTSICYDKRMYINYLSREEKIKHNVFTRRATEDREDYIDAILDNLTPDDVRCLIVAEDEFARCSPLERIFPTCDTYKYLKYTEGARYYNRLLDAWENRYGKNRAEGIALLRDFCMDNYHLEVPPLPAKKDFIIKFLRWILKS
ncbi:probable beta-tubulin polyglutamylase isoform X2 [Teleopsis dalmanni]|uniref:probable beta-tubulin polyglutamylase isoform X2 n=1 Tax=Teleopsis dalmanni TaxID=139649 RepID=UPI0018CFA6D1|nr:probable beta-tubulin polyglutamylase isoform X2 [Teleopsis dalmanni]